MVDPSEFGERLRSARALLEVHGRISYREIAEAVAEKTGREKPHRETSVGRWIKGESFPDVPSIWALGELFGVDPGWLAFGDASRAPAPGVPTPSTSIPDVARIAAIVDAEIPPEAKPGAKPQKEAG